MVIALTARRSRPSSASVLTGGRYTTLPGVEPFFLLAAHTPRRPMGRPCGGCKHTACTLCMGMYLGRAGRFFLAGQFRWLGCWLWDGRRNIPGASLTGILNLCRRSSASWAFGLHTTQRTLVTEFQPSSGEVLALIIMAPVDSASTAG